MPINTQAQFSVQLLWSQTDTEGGDNKSVTDNSSLGASEVWTTGTGTSQNVNTVYLDAGELNAGQTVAYDLTDLTRTLFNGELNTSFSGGKIRGLCIENSTAEDMAPILFSATGANAFNEPWNNSDTSVPIYPNACVIQTNSYSGYDCNASNRMFYLTNLATGVSSYEIGVVGQI